MVTRTTFKELPIGVPFEFASAIDHPNWALARGPWIRISPRKYCRANYPTFMYANQVGSIHSPVIIVEEKENES